MTEITLRKSAIDTISANTLDENSGLRVQVKENDLLTDLQSANLLTNQQLITVQFADLADLDLPDFTTVFVSDIGCNSLNTPGGSLWYTKDDLWYPVGGQITNYFLKNAMASTPNTADDEVTYFDLPADFIREGTIVTISYGYERIGNQTTGEDLTMELRVNNVGSPHGIDYRQWVGNSNTQVVYGAKLNVLLAANPLSLYARLVQAYPVAVATWQEDNIGADADVSEPIRIAFNVANTATNNDNLKINLTHLEITTRFF